MSIDKQKFSNNASTILSSSITDVATTIGVLDGSYFPALGVDEYFYATLIGSDVNGNENAWEIVKVTARSANLLTVVRGQDNTVAQDWPQSARIELRLNAGTMADIANSLASGSTEILTYEYESRNDLRLVDGPAGAIAIIEGLGLFVWKAGSTEPYDDVSCFDTTSGRWLLQAIHWNIVIDYLLPELNDIANRTNIITTTFNQNITTVTANSKTTITVPLPGALIGDAVIITRSNAHNSSPQGVVIGVVLSAGVVTIHLCATTVVTYFHAGTWRVTVIKS